MLILEVLVKKVVLKGGSDGWVWLKDNNGIFSVRSAYQWLRVSDIIVDEVFYKKLWDGGALLKIKAFVWKLSQDRIPTAQNLVRHNVPLQSTICKGCDKAVESASHLFFQCEKYSRVWQECLRWWGLESPLHETCKMHFMQFSALINGFRSRRCGNLCGLLLFG